MLSLSLLLVTQLATPSPVDSVQLVTRDIANFWRAYDLAAGKDSAEQVRIFETIYLQPGSTRLRGQDFRAVRPAVSRRRAGARARPIPALLRVRARRHALGRHE